MPLAIDMNGSVGRLSHRVTYPHSTSTITAPSITTLQTHGRSMKPAVMASAVVLAASSGFAQAQIVQAGVWEISSTLSGTPNGDVKNVKKACITRSDATSRFEQSVLDAASSDSSAPKGPPKCVLQNVQRDGAKSTWQSTCEGPLGPFEGSGIATSEASRMILNQSFQIKGPFGNLKLTQTVVAQRLGDCQ